MHFEGNMHQGLGQIEYVGAWIVVFVFQETINYFHGELY